ncbi:Cell death protease [Tulasnella sp. 332]|nr:Cell death protease [Tulasnella sp. 332]
MLLVTASRFARAAAALLLVAPFVLSAPAPLSAASFYVPTLPGLVQDKNHPVNIYAGHLLSDPSGSFATPSKQVLGHLYFVLLKARRTADKERLIIWFNGGPGCSSFDGLMMEVGPWRIDGKGGLKMVEGGWDEYAHVLYLDQPVGTGFSYASTDNYVKELDQARTLVVSAHVNQFLTNFYEVFPEMRRVDTYLAGESFAGQYIPYVASGILKTTLLKTPLKGIAIGNGWIDPIAQYPAYYDFARASGLVTAGSNADKKAKKALETCYETLNTLNKTRDFIPVNVDNCDIMNEVGRELLQVVNGETRCVNVYDVRLSDTYPSCGMNWPPDLHSVTDYLRRRDVVSALHATDKSEAWTECQGSVYSSFELKTSPASVTLLPSILDQIPVMLFAGDQDFICNYMGIEKLIDNLEWKGAKGMQGAPVLPWVLNGTEAGFWTTARNLTYVKISGASHMVGFDVPMAAHDMMLRFMGVDLSLATAGLPARLPSSVGDDVRLGVLTPPTPSTDSSAPTSTTTVEQDKARWEAYYNAGSAALVLVLVLLAIGLFFLYRSRRKQGAPGVKLSRENDFAEETIPLHDNIHLNGRDDEIETRQRKGKGREGAPAPASRSVLGEAIFDAGGSDEDEDEDEDEDDRNHSHNRGFQDE